MNINSPIIIIGMSRSGTSMLARILDELGLFVGKSKNNNHEAKFFVKLNKWLLYQTSGGLENPESIKYLLQDTETRKYFGEFISFGINSPRFISYLGLKNYLNFRSKKNINFPWGWKDPRNTYTLPFWLDIFPEARVIHIYRHGLDIINSLATRREKGLLRLSTRHKKWKNIYWHYLIHKFIDNNRIFVDLRSSTIEEGLKMWEEYLSIAQDHVIKLKERAIEVKYENILEQPETEIEIIAKFCGLNTNKDSIIKACRGVKKSRAYAFRKNTNLNPLAKTYSDLLSTYGY